MCVWTQQRLDKFDDSHARHCQHTDESPRSFFGPPVPRRVRRRPVRRAPRLPRPAVSIASRTVSCLGPVSSRARSVSVPPVPLPPWSRRGGRHTGSRPAVDPTSRDSISHRRAVTASVNVGSAVRRLSPPPLDSPTVPKPAGPKPIPAASLSAHVSLPSRPTSHPLCRLSCIQRGSPSFPHRALFPDAAGESRTGSDISTTSPLVPLTSRLQDSTRTPRLSARLLPS